MKKCRLCGIQKPLTDFAIAAQCRDGHRGECLKCQSQQQKERNALPETKAKRKLYFSDPTVRARQNAHRQSPEGKASYRRRAEASPSFALSFALYRAVKRRPTDNPVTHAELMQMFREQDGKCAISGIALTWQRGKIQPNSLSIDRIEPSRGYTKANVRLVCHAINMFRGDHTDNDMFAMALAIVTNMKKPKLRLVS